MKGVPLGRLFAAVKYRSHVSRGSKIEGLSSSTGGGSADGCFIEDDPSGGVRRVPDVGFETEGCNETLFLRPLFGDDVEARSVVDQASLPQDVQGEMHVHPIVAGDANLHRTRTAVLAADGLRARVDGLGNPQDRHLIGRLQHQGALIGVAPLQSGCGLGRQRRPPDEVLMAVRPNGLEAGVGKQRNIGGAERRIAGVVVVDDDVGAGRLQHGMELVV